MARVLSSGAPRRFCYPWRVSGPWDPYYGGHQTVTLERHVAVTGFFGVGVEQLAHAFVGRTGVPWTSLPRWIEHRTGKELARALAEADPPGRAALERAALAEALRGPPGLVSLLPDSLDDRELAELVESRLTLVRIMAPLKISFERIVTRRQTHPLAFAPALAGSLHGPDELEELHARWLAQTARAAHSVEWGAGAVHGPVERLIVALGLEPAAAP